MADKKIKKVSPKKGSHSILELEDLDLFIKKKKIQNEILQKILQKINSPEENKDNK